MIRETGLAAELKSSLALEKTFNVQGLKRLSHFLIIVIYQAVAGYNILTRGAGGSVHPLPSWSFLMRTLSASVTGA